MNVKCLSTKYLNNLYLHFFFPECIKTGKIITLLLYGRPNSNNRFLAVFQSHLKSRGGYFCFAFVIQDMTRLPFTMTRTSHAIDGRNGAIKRR